MGIEFEVKFRATEELLDRIHREVPGQTQIYRMKTTYYDTPSGAFSAEKCTLRHRMENQTGVCTLKAPAKGFGRREWEVVCDDIHLAISELCKLDCPKELLALAGEGLIPVCGAEFTRVAKILTLGDGTAELAMDRGILTGGTKQIPLCEIEIEKKTCSDESCLAFANALAAHYGLQTEPCSKFKRALDLYKGE